MIGTELFLERRYGTGVRCAPGQTHGRGRDCVIDCRLNLGRPSRPSSAQQRSAKLSLTELSNDQIHAVAAYLVVAEAIVRTRLPVDVQPEGRRYRVRVGRSAVLVQVFSPRSGDWQLDIKNPLAPDT